MDDKEHTEESIRLRANESLLNSKGFLLFVVNQDGTLETVGDETVLTPAERWGLNTYRRRKKI